MSGLEDAHGSDTYRFHILPIFRTVCLLYQAVMFRFIRISSASVWYPLRPNLFLDRRL